MLTFLFVGSSFYLILRRTEHLASFRTGTCSSCTYPASQVVCKAKAITRVYSCCFQRSGKCRTPSRKNSALPTGSKDAAKGGSARRSPIVKGSPSAAKTTNASSKDKPASEQGPDLKKSVRSSAKPDAAAATGDKAAGKGGSRSQAVVEKLAGRKRRSRSGERSRSPKRKATSPAARKSGGESLVSSAACVLG